MRLPEQLAPTLRALASCPTLTGPTSPATAAARRGGGGGAVDLVRRSRSLRSLPRALGLWRHAMRAALREWEAHNVTLHELRLFAADPAAFADAAHGDPGTQRMLEEGVHVAQLNETARIALAAASSASGTSLSPPRWGRGAPCRRPATRRGRTARRRRAGPRGGEPAAGIVVSRGAYVDICWES